MTMSASVQQQRETCCINLFTDNASAEVFTCGASVHHYAVRQANGCVFKPFAEAKWLDKYRHLSRSDVPRHLQILGGEFACVPFGTTSLDTAHHGYCVDHDWHVTARTENAVTLEIKYPEHHVVRRLKRQITLDPKTDALDFTLEIKPRKDCQLPVGIHPIFKVANDMKIAPPFFEHGASAPWQIDGNDRRELSSGAKLNPQSHLWNNIGVACNELLQIWNVRSNIALHYPSEQTIVHLNWDQNDLPHCLFWLANPGLEQTGLGAGFTGLGIEPTHSFFDQNDQAGNHLALHQCEQNHFGVPLVADQIWTTSYQISCRQSGPSENFL